MNVDPRLAEDRSNIPFQQAIKGLNTSKNGEPYRVKFQGAEYIITPIKAGILKKLSLKLYGENITYKEENKLGELDTDNTTNFKCDNQIIFSIYKVGKKLYIERKYGYKKNIYLLLK